METAFNENSQCECKNTQGGLGQLSTNCNRVGDEQNQLNQSNSKGQRVSEEGSSLTQQQRYRIAGGILRRLARIEENNLKFVNSHKERLKKRLADDDLEIARIKQDVEELRTEILSLLELKEQ